MTLPGWLSGSRDHDNIKLGISDFRVRFDVNTTEGEGSFTVKVHAEWAPRGAVRFKELLEAKFFDNSRFFRVVPGMLIQFGMHAKGKVNQKWKNKTIEDDRRGAPNDRGTLTFGTRGTYHTRGTQIFINLKHNDHLDVAGYVPIGKIEGDGMSVAEKVYDCGEEPDQEEIRKRGNKYLDKDFPKLSRIKQVRIIGNDEL
eukprot:gnl/MRDRNA2_/MRDRNA2_173084_c0_seq1.p1 gnl/MRDRNA2_/MRDRNA2_173084_c0~~gnl/MRDRNA2_/MRDRNA2_173084_c0_seq1.p1  ORF type:complete len:209 (-),score=24.38 gnl/MRDRNA2_/MRDRNA2_173084_c0_seq1:111-707(-)